MGSQRYFAAGGVTVFAGYLTGILTVLLRGQGNAQEVMGYLTSDLRPDWFQGFVSGPLFVLLVQFCGVFLFGWLFIFPLIFYKSYGLGYTAGLFLGALGTKGLLPLGLCLFPSALAECLLLIFAAKEAFPQSLALFHGLQGGGTGFFEGVRRYLLRSLVLFQCSSFVLIWDLFLSPLILSGIRDML